MGSASLARERWDANIPHCDRRESQSPEEGVQACGRNTEHAQCDLFHKRRPWRPTAAARRDTGGRSAGLGAKGGGATRAPPARPGPRPRERGPTTAILEQRGRGDPGRGPGRKRKCQGSGRKGGVARPNLYNLLSRLKNLSPRGDTRRARLACRGPRGARKKKRMRPGLRPPLPPLLRGGTPGGHVSEARAAGLGGGGAARP